MTKRQHEQIYPSLRHLAASRPGTGTRRQPRLGCCDSGVVIFVVGWGLLRGNCNGSRRDQTRQTRVSAGLVPNQSVAALHDHASHALCLEATAVKTDAGGLCVWTCKTRASMMSATCRMKFVVSRVVGLASRHRPFAHNDHRHTSVL